MKKICLGLILTSLVVSAFCQDDRQVRFAFTGSPVISWLKPDGEYLTQEKNRLGFNFGLLADLMIADNPNYAFSTGIIINNQGGAIRDMHYHDGDTSILAFGDIQKTYKLQYIDIPLTLKLKTNEIGYLTYFGQFGLDIGFNIKARQDFEGTYAEGNLSKKDIDVLDEIKPIRASLVVAAGAEFNVSGNTNLMAGITWNNGLSNILSLKENKEDANGNPSFAANQQLLKGPDLKAISNYISLNIAVFF